MGVLFSSVASKPVYNTQYVLRKGLESNPMKFFSGFTALLRVPVQKSLLISPFLTPTQPLSHLQPRSHKLGLTPASRALGLQRPLQRQHLPSQAGMFLPSTPARLLARVHSAEGVLDLPCY